MVGMDASASVSTTIVRTAEEMSKGSAASVPHANGSSKSLVYVVGGRANEEVANVSPRKANGDHVANGKMANGTGVTLNGECKAEDAVSEKKEVSSNGASKTTKEMSRQKSGRHAGVGHKTILRNDELNQYILSTNVYPREHEQLRELRLMTTEHRWNLMLSPADEGQFLQLLLKLMNAKNTIEIGTYTGYSLLATALALPADGKIIAMDLNRNCLDLGWPYVEKAGMANKIDFIGGPALDSLNALLTDEKNHNFFDFVFVDADKNNYTLYHECLLKLVRVGGVIAYDNTLWNGSVTATEEELQEMPKYIRHYQPFIIHLNDFLSKDPRVEPALISIGDGVTLCRRVL